MNPLLRLICSLLVLSLVVGCNGEESASPDEAAPQPLSAENNGAEVANGAPARRTTAEDVDSLFRRLDLHGGFSTFLMGMTITNSTDEFSEDEEYTFFVPDDDAFHALLEDDEFENLLRKEQHQRLREILFHHVLDGRFAVDELEPGEYQTMSGASIEITMEDGEVFYGHAGVTDTDYRAANGIFHVLDEVVLPAE